MVRIYTVFSRKNVTLRKYVYINQVIDNVGWPLCNYQPLSFRYDGEKVLVYSSKMLESQDKQMKCIYINSACKTFNFGKRSIFRKKLCQHEKILMNNDYISIFVRETFLVEHTV